MKSIFLFIIFTFLFLIFLYILYLKIKEWKIRKNEFILYLEQKKKIKLLIDLGYYNKNGYKEERRVIGFYESLIQEYNIDKDEKYIEYGEYVSKQTKIQILLMLLMFSFFCCAVYFGT